MVRVVVAALVLAVSLFVATAGAQSVPARPPEPGAVRPAAPGFDPESLASEYRIAPGDVVQVFVWREADLSREVRVRTDGNLTVPLIGDLLAAGKTPRELADELGRALAQFITSPVVNVILKESSTLRFFVLGEVGKPGEYPLLGRTTVMQALALAGGFREYAKTEEIKILRQDQRVIDGRPQTQETALAVNYKLLAQGQNLQQDLVLKPGDVIVVP